MPIMCDDGTMDGTAYQKWNDLFLEGCKKVGKDPSLTGNYKRWVVDAGFDEVVEQVFKWPINTWPKENRLKELGKWNMINMLDGLEGFTARLFNKVLGMSMDEVQILLADVRKDLQNRKIHSYWRM